MLAGITLLLVCQLAGELISQYLSLPVPGPVIGMVILFVGLVFRGHVPEDLGKVAQGLLGNLALLFVPAGVGIMVYLNVVAAQALPIATSVILGTALTIAVTGLIAKGVSRLRKRPDGEA